MNDSTTLTEEQKKTLDAMVEATKAYTEAALAALQAGAEVDRICDGVPPDVTLDYIAPEAQAFMEKIVEGQSDGMKLGIQLTLAGLANGGNAREQIDKASAA